MQPTTLSFDNEPASTTLKPITTTQQPAATTQQPAATTQKPAATTQQPAPITQQPASITQQPASNTQQQQADEEVVAGSHLQSAANLVSKPIFKTNEQGSLLCKFLTQDVWDRLKDTKDSSGFSFKEAIFSGSKNPDSGIGVYAGSANSYEAFAPLFEPIVEDYHKYNLSTGH